MIIYKTTNLINGKIYVGKDSLNDPDYLGSGFILHRAIKKYGVHNFRKDIIEHCQSPRELDEREKYWIKQLNSTDRRCGYNIAKGGTGGDTFTNLSSSKKKDVIEKRKATRPIWDTAEYRQKIRVTTTTLWKNPHHRNHMAKVMTGRKIKWSDKISKSITEWHKIHTIPEASKRHAAEINRQKMTGHEFKPFPNEVKERIVEMYQSIGPKRIARQLRMEGHDASPYLVINVLKKAGIYQKWKKGIAEA